MGQRNEKSSMYLYEASATQTINTTNVYHAITGLLEGSVNGATSYKASLSGSISLTANNGGVLRCTDVGHGLDTGDYITLNGMGDAAHNGITRVTVIDTDVFDCDDIAYSSSADTGSWQRGASMTINYGYGGIYNISFSITGSVGAANKNIKVEAYKNITPLDEFAIERLFGNTGYGNAGSTGVALLTSGDVLWLASENTTDAADWTIRHANINISK